jgi:hypothetical protein
MNVVPAIKLSDIGEPAHEFINSKELSYFRSIGDRRGLSGLRADAREGRFKAECPFHCVRRFEYMPQLLRASAGEDS